MRNVTQADRALVHPTALLALALLGLNDHVLKGGAWLPGPLTGKLSDFAGVFVAPILLAVLVRARRTRALTLCFAAVAGVFTALEISPALTAAVSRHLGIAIWPDLTDLFALSMLWPAWRLVTRVPQASAARERLVVPVAAIALLLCMATSPAYQSFVRKGSTFSATAVLHNGTKRPMSVTVNHFENVPCERVLAGDVSMFAKLKSDSMNFWLLDPDQNIPLLEGVEIDDRAKCHLITVQHVLFVFPAHAIARRYVPHFGAPSSGAVLVQGDDRDNMTIPTSVAPIKRLDLPKK